MKVGLFDAKAIVVILLAWSSSFVIFLVSTGLLYAAGTFLPGKLRIPIEPSVDESGLASHNCASLAAPFSHGNVGTKSILRRSVHL